MKIINKTYYDTKYLKRLLNACENYVCTNAVNAVNSTPKIVTIKHTQAKTKIIRAAYYRKPDNYNINLRLPKPYNYHHGVMQGKQYVQSEIPTNPSAWRLCQYYIFCRKRQFEIGCPTTVDLDMEIPFWPNDFIPSTIETTETKSSIVQTRAESAKQQLKVWNTKLKLAKTKVKHYTNKVNYYKKKGVVQND